MTEHESFSPPLRSSVHLNWLVVFLLMLVSVLVLRTLYPNLSPLLNPQAVPRAITARGDLAEDEKGTIEVFKEASPSVVHITTISRRQNFLGESGYEEVREGTGSGFVWSDDGYIVTNFHVVLQLVNKGQGAKVTLAKDGSTYDARLVGAAPDFDLAVLKIDVPLSQLKPIGVGTSKDLQVGQKVFAIGNPFGLDQTLTTGVIGGLGRQIRSITNHPIQGVIQTDAAINPGNSGGPLLDSAGRLIGVNTMIYSPTGANAGIGYAVPVDTVNRVVPQLIQKGQVDRPVLGITTIDDRWIQILVNRKVLPRPGVVVLRFPTESSAAKAGLRATQWKENGEMILGDIIIGLNDHDIRSTDELSRILEEYKVGDQVALKILRGADQLLVNVTLQSSQSVKLPSGDQDIPDEPDPVVEGVSEEPEAGK